jgi:anti-sigma B factor antagonist
MEIKTHEKEDVKVVDLIGNLDTATSPEAEASINELLEAGTTRLVINLEKTDYMSSSGLRVFLGTTKKLMASGGKVVLCNPNSLVNEILEHSGFNTIIEIKPTLDDALESVRT